MFSSLDDVAAERGELIQSNVEKRGHSSGSESSTSEVDSHPDSGTETDSDSDSDSISEIVSDKYCPNGCGEVFSSQINANFHANSDECLMNCIFEKPEPPQLIYNESKCRSCEKVNDLLACRGCGISRYCSKQCQIEDWKNHKNLCKYVKGKRNSLKGKPRDRFMESVKNSSKVCVASDCENSEEISEEDLLHCCKFLECRNTFLCEILDTSPNHVYHKGCAPKHNCAVGKWVKFTFAFQTAAQIHEKLRTRTEKERQGFMQNALIGAFIQNCLIVPFEISKEEQKGNTWEKAFDSFEFALEFHSCEKKFQPLQVDFKEVYSGESSEINRLIVATIRNSFSHAMFYFIPDTTQIQLKFRKYLKTNSEKFELCSVVIDLKKLLRCGGEYVQACNDLAIKKLSLFR